MRQSAVGVWFVCCGVAIGSIAGSSAGEAQSAPNQERNLDPGKLYDFSSVDTISTYQGSILWTIPIGPAFPNNAEMATRLRLVGSSVVWDFESVTVPIPDCLPPQPCTYEATEAYPQRHGNAGFSWRLSLGELLSVNDARNRTYLGADATARPVFVDSDFGEHVLYQTAHVGDSDTAPGESSTYYSRDGSALRLREISTNLAELDEPNGTIKTFTRANASSPYFLTEIRDRFGNDLAITYNTTPPSGFSSQWKLDDGIRVHYVRFKIVAGTEVVSQIALAGFGATTSVYNLAHAATPIDRSCKHETDHPGAPPATVTVPLLTSVTLPSGASYVMEQYNTTGSCGLSGAVADRPGTLARLRLPTRGVLEWTYGTRNSHNSGVGYPPSVSLNSSAGVATRKVLPENGVCADSPEGGNCTWTYAYSANGPGIDSYKVITTSPLGDDTVAYFSTPPNRILNGPGTSPDWTGWDYGLPFHPGMPEAGGTGRFLSTQVYDGSWTSGTLRRSTYVAYERDQIPGALGGPEPPADQWYNTNRRMASIREIFHDDGGKSITTDYGSWDGLSSYRTTTVSSSGFEGLTRTTTTNYNPPSGSNPGTGEYRVSLVDNSVLTAFTMLPATEDWSISSYDKITVTEGGSQIVTEACFDRDGANETGYATTGAILRTRSFADATSPSDAGGSDVVASYGRDAQGNVTDEQWFGGDGANLGTGALCTVALTNPDYRMFHTYSNGARATSRYVNPNGTNLSPSFFVLDRTLDATGLTSEERDTAGMKTRFEYDSSYRLSRVYGDGGAGTADDGAEWRYTYNNAAGSTLANVAIRACNPGGGSCTDTNALQSSEVLYDGHGRIERERRLLPSGSFSKRVYATSAMGYRLKASELQSDSIGDASLDFTLWKGFDPFGRPTRITPPDGTSHDVTLAYTGSRQVARTVKVATSITGSETDATTTETYDLHGRLRRVEEPAGTSDAITSATYGYDAAGRLTSVAHFANVSGTGNVTQNRTFVFDGRGFLTEETMPEKVGRVCYLGYDARGHATRKVDPTGSTCSSVPTNGQRDLLFTFDAAERLRTVSEGGAGGRLLKELFYDADPLAPVEPTGASLGKLVHTVNHNHLIGTDILARQTLFYFGVEGRLSSRDTETWQAPVSTLNRFIEQGWTYDRLGQVVTIDYPNETAGGFFDTLGSQPRSQAFTYSRGFLTAVPGVATSLTYHGNATPHQIVHANGVTETIARDPDWMARPASISTSGVDGGANWSSGAYAYDGAGNVEAIGNDRFRYDKVSRLLESRMRLVPGLAGTEHTQTFGFDGFGNLLSITGTGGTSLPTSASTNRLTAGGAVFDDAGNLTSWNGNSYTFDRLNRMSERVTAGANQRLWKFLYTADDERLWSADISEAFGEQRVMVRDLDGKPLREYAYEPPAVQGSLTEGGAAVSSFVGVCPASPPDDIFCDGFESGGTSAWQPPTDDRYRDWIHRGSQLLAADDSEDGRSHYHLDHLGTPRQITGVIPAGAPLALHAYLPYGAELPGSTQNHERLRFTGHERDLSNFSNPADDLDYLHARHSSPILGRFLTVDPLASSASPAAPQTWNRYAYGAGNPLKFVDPDGRAPAVAAALPIAAVVGLALASSAFLQSESSAYPGRTNAAVIGASIDKALSSIGDSLTAAQSIILQASSNESTGTEVAQPAENAEDARAGAGSSTEEVSRQLGDRAKEGTSAEAEQQLDEIEEQQTRTRTGKAKGVIDSIEKSRQRMKHKHRQIKDLKDSETDG